MSNEEINVALGMYQNKVDHLDPIENAEEIALYKSQIESLKNELHHKSTGTESTERQDLFELIAFYKNILDNPELDPEKRILYMGELQKLQTILEDNEEMSQKK